ncbi:MULTISPECIES: alpha/beta fold hydrolase [unclassified Rathayibacter]|uniref:alpha/beta fold hydrolase n=1 Tax=unclassified Rathayibacter TaxID=2609250 RepID=UPI0006F2F1D4|nr:MULTISPECIES: alpha/beta hydrolase [unclassified Rathayibacter]KQQ04187.1 hydrolase [Rathayibacter sp. Leaf294]KQS12640.1 hydrolase [Rathayibacter sp. Leaf185]
MHLSESGDRDGAPVLLLHGGGVAGWMWTELRKVLEADHLVLVPDLPGHGGSADEDYRSHSSTVDVLATVLRRSARGPAAVIGFSLGAQLAMRLASEHPDLVGRVMIVSAQARPLPFARATLLLLGLAAPLSRRRWFARLQARELFIPDESMEDYIRTSARISRRTLLEAVGENLRFEIPAGWSDVTGDALVMAGSRERSVMRRSAAAIHEALPGSILEIIDGGGHGIPLQRPEWFAARVARWLSADGSPG